MIGRVTYSAHRHVWSVYLLTGGGMIAGAAALAMMSGVFGRQESTLAAREAQACWGVLTGGVYFAGLWMAHGAVSFNIKADSRRCGRARLGWILGVGIAMRLIVMPTQPFLEDDYHRHLWDGAVLAHGINPYQHAPQDVQDARLGALHSDPSELVRLADEGRETLAKVNHPHLTTVYGPVAQIFFAAAHLVAPWNIVGWRIVLATFDVATMALVLVLLRKLGRPSCLAAWYWWNPLLLREVFSSGHMDVVVLPFVALAMLLAIRRAPMSAGLALALGAGAKIWPVVLVPLFVRAATERTVRMLLGVGTFAVAAGLCWAPVIMASSSDANGLRAYALTWYNNNALFHLVTLSMPQALELIGANPPHGALAARWAVAGMLFTLSLLLARRRCTRADQLFDRSSIVVAVMFFLSPTQFPWYYLWMLPLPAVAPRLSLLAYTALLPLYYLQYDRSWLVWIEHVPIIVWFLAESGRMRHKRTMPLLQTGAA